MKKDEKNYLSDSEKGMMFGDCDNGVRLLIKIDFLEWLGYDEIEIFSMLSWSFKKGGKNE